MKGEQSQKNLGEPINLQNGQHKKSLIICKCLNKEKSLNFISLRKKPQKRKEKLNQNMAS